jgi:hypothetical protein
MNTRLAILGSVFAISSAAVAQQAVQWKVSDGGNGHWYALRLQSLPFEEAQDWSVSRGGNLVTYSSDSEQDFVWASFAAQIAPNPFWIGCSQEPGACEPGCGWRWVTDEPLLYSRWIPGEPNDNQVYGNENAACIDGSNRWNDIAGHFPIPFVIEWSADCNSDGIVDYGQCRNGSLPDYDSNNIPDCCEAGVPCVVGDYPVEWREGDGGNGHWYAAMEVTTAADCWDQNRQQAMAMGGDLATITSSQENAVVFSTVAGLPGNVSIGGYKNLPSGEWLWVSGESWSFTNWQGGEPGCCAPNEWWLDLNAQTGRWRDRAQCISGSPGAMVVEWSADCNGDSIVDYGQILRGELADTDENGVPDVCEVDPCPGDVNSSGVVNAVDISVILSAWGTNGGKFPRADTDGNGVVDAADLSVVLSGWGPCP